MIRVNAVILVSAIGLLCSARNIDRPPTRATHSVVGHGASSPDTRRQGYVGDAVCANCHKQESLGYSGTAHHLTSQLPTHDSVLGSFDSGSNRLMIADPARANEDNPGLYFEMEQRGEDFYQTAITGWPGHLTKRSARIDIVIGSGRRGQSYLYWDNDELFELPVSYWADGGQWINSPGYKNGEANFTRPIFPRCLECHATYIKPLSDDPSANRYEKSTLEVGISCETCHGPGAKHVEAQEAHNPTTGRINQSILNPAHFSRDRQVDLCGFCHNGIRQQGIAPAFSYLPGEPLDSYLEPDTAEIAEHPNVHGNQVGLLKRSRCYLSSPKMTCSTCHDEHAQEKPAASYSARCLTCHDVKSCGRFRDMGKKIAENCIDCHMPVEETSLIVSNTAGQIVRAKMRNHWIKIYR